jgi:hypothetical protein
VPLCTCAVTIFSYAYPKTVFMVCTYRYLGTQAKTDSTCLGWLRSPEYLKPQAG